MERSPLWVRSVATKPFSSASTLPRIFPMLTTAQVPLPQAHSGDCAGVAGAASIATAHRLGRGRLCVEFATGNPRTGAKPGGRFLNSRLKQRLGGWRTIWYRGRDENFYARQRELLSPWIAGSDVVITTAVVPGRKAPVLVTARW